MNVIKFCFVAPFLFLIPSESLPVVQPSITPHFVHIRKDFPGIISFGPIYLNSVKRGIFTDHISVYSCNGCPNGINENSPDIPLAGCKGNPEIPEAVEVEEPMEVISIEEEKPAQKSEEDIPVNDLVSDYEDFVDDSALTSKQIYLIQAAELNRLKERELNKQFEILNQVKEISPVEEPANIQDNEIQSIVYENDEPSEPEETNQIVYIENNDLVPTDPTPNQPPEPEIESVEAQENTFATQEHTNDSTEPQNPEYENTEAQDNQNEPYESGEPVDETKEPETPVNEPLESTTVGIPSEFQEQEAENVEENSTELSTWNGPTSPEIAQSVNEYIDNYKPAKIFHPCPPKDSTQISERHQNLIKSSRVDLKNRIRKFFNGARAYAARDDAMDSY